MAKRIVIFASGSGSNAENLVTYFGQPSKSAIGTVVTIITNNSNAGVIERSKRLSVPCVVLTKEQWENRSYVSSLLKNLSVDLVVLAGFLKQFPAEIIGELGGHVINLHPALLPKFGGKGMFGMNVHQAVIDAKEKMSGITIHWVNDQYDEGAIIAQFTCPIALEDTAESLAHKIHRLEYLHFPAVVEEVLSAIAN